MDVSFFFMVKSLKLCEGSMKDESNRRNGQLYGPLPLLPGLAKVQVSVFPMLDWKGGNK